MPYRPDLTPIVCNTVAQFVYVGVGGVVVYACGAVADAGRNEQASALVIDHVVGRVQQ